MSLIDFDESTVDDWPLQDASTCCLWMGHDSKNDCSSTYYTNLASFLHDYAVPMVHDVLSCPDADVDHRHHLHRHHQLQQNHNHISLRKKFHTHAHARRVDKFGPRGQKQYRQRNYLQRAFGSVRDHMYGRDNEEGEDRVTREEDDGELLKNLFLKFPVARGGSISIATPDDRQVVAQARSSRGSFLRR